MLASTPFRISTSPRFHDAHIGAALLVYLTARPEYPTHAGLTEDGILHVHLQTLRTGERLNHMLLRYLARHLRVPVEDMEIGAGEESAGKIVCFYHITPAELERRLRQWLQGAHTPLVW